MKGSAMSQQKEEFVLNVAACDACGETPRKYFVHSVKAVPDWNTIPVAPLDCCAWGGSYRVYGQAQLVLLRDVGFVCRLQCEEQAPVARYQTYFSPVYQDSCMEFFCAFDQNSEKYLNVEMNAKGTCLCEIGTNRHDRVDASENGTVPPVKVEPFAQRTSWSLLLTIPFVTLTRLFGVTQQTFVPGYQFRGNFYKCGDASTAVHYTMWNPVRTPAPDFHQPSFFGTFVMQ